MEKVVINDQKPVPFMGMKDIARFMWYYSL